MPFFAASEAPPSPESMKFPVFSLLAGNLAFSETSSQLTPPSSGESIANLTAAYMVGGLFAFMMLSGRVAQPLVGLARLVQEYEEVNAAIGEAARSLWVYAPLKPVRLLPVRLLNVARPAEKRTELGT
jgi:hypothetical protein